MLYSSLRVVLMLFICLFCLGGNFGCDRGDRGTSGALKADYDRVVKERDDLKADFEKRKEEIERLWQQRVSDKDQKIADLTAENANLRQRLLVADAVSQDIPLTDAARTRSLLWLHVIYCLIIGACLVAGACVVWAHASLRERVRLYVMQQAKFVPMKEVIDVRN